MQYDGVKYMVMEGELTLGREHTMQHVDDIELYTSNLYNYSNPCHPSKLNKKNFLMETIKEKIHKLAFIKIKFLVLLRKY